MSEADPDVNSVSSELEPLNSPQVHSYDAILTEAESNAAKASREYRAKVTYRSVGWTLFVLVFVTLFVVLDTKYCLNKSSEALLLEIKSVDIYGERPAMDVEALFSFDYSRITGWWAQLNLQLTSRIIRNTKFSIVEPIDLDVDGLNLGRFELLDEESSFEIDLGPKEWNRVVLHNVSMDLQGENIAETANSVFNGTLDRLRVGCAMTVDFSILSGMSTYLQMSLQDVHHIVQEVEHGLALDGNDVTFDGTKINGVSELLLDVAEFDFLSVEVPEQEYEVQLANDSDGFVGVLNASIPSADVEMPLALPVSYVVPPLPENLDPSVPQSVLDGTPLPIVLRGLSAGSWMSEIVPHLRLPLNISSNQIAYNYTNPVQGVELVDVSIAEESDSLLVGSTLNVLTNLGYSLDVPKISSRLSLFRDEIALFNMTAQCQAQSASLNGSLFTVQENGKITFEDDDAVAAAGRLANDLLREAVTVHAFGDVNATVESRFVNASVGLQGGFEQLLPEVPPSSPGNVTLNGVTVINVDKLRMALSLDVGFDSPLAITNDLPLTLLDVYYRYGVVAQVGIEPVKLVKGANNATFDLILYRGQLEELFGRYMSGYTSNVTLVGHSVAYSPKLSTGIAQLSGEVELPRFANHDSLFIVDSTMHIMTSSLQLTVYNPIGNKEVVVDVIAGRAVYKKELLGYVSKETRLVIPPGVYKTPNIPVTYSTTGLGGDILRKALNGDLVVQAEAELQMAVESFELEILYSGHGMKTKIRL